MQGTERVSSAQAGPLHHIVVRPAEKPILSQREFISGDELSAAGYTAETLDVVHLGAGAHHEVVLAEAYAAFGAFDPVQPARDGPSWEEKHRDNRVTSGRLWPKMGSNPGHKP